MTTLNPNVEPLPPSMAHLPIDPDRGRRNDPLFNLYRGMLKRCQNPATKGYHNYGGRGIKVCERWRGPRGFDNFVADVGERPSADHSLDRFPDPNGDYEPGNVRWATRSEQNRNRRDNRRLTARGKTQTLEEWAAETGLPKSTLFNRILRGWKDEAVVSTPAQSKAADNTLFPPGGRAQCVARGISSYTVASRLRRGWSFERALSAPVAKQKGGRGNAG